MKGLKMTKAEMEYRDALHIDFVKFSNAIMIAYFLMNFRVPSEELERLMDTWLHRISTFRDNTLKNAAKENDIEPDVAKIISSLHDEFDRETILKDVAETIHNSIKETMQNIT